MRFLFSGTASILAFLFFIYSPAFAITENINVFFNTPEEGVSTSIISNPEVGLDDSLVNLINSATPSDTIYAAFYEISDNSIMGALNTAAQAGTNVYFIKDNSTSDTDYNTLDSSINKKKGGSIMHNKFLVIKDKAIWMGSANPTRGGFITGNNNALVIKSAELARIYEDEFNHMWSGNFGSNKTLDQNGTKVTVDGVDIEVFFSPHPGIFLTSPAQALVDHITQAEHSVYFNLFTFSFNEESIIGALEYAHLAGVEVRGVVESGQGTSMSTLEILRGMGIDVIPDGNPGNLHHKFVVIDAGTPNAKVITGSYNWTPNALNDNDENFLVIHSSAMADLFWQEFQKNYSIASGSLYVRDEPAIGNLLVYPSPAKFTDDLSVEYRLSSMVQEVSATIFTLSGAEVVTINPSFYPGSDNKFIWDMKNKAGHDIAPGLYFIRLEVKTGDGNFSSMDKFAVIR